MDTTISTLEAVHPRAAHAAFARVNALRHSIAHHLTSALRPSEESCELNHVFEEAWAGAAHHFAHVFVSRTHEAVMRVRLSESELKRIFTLMLNGLAASAVWSETESASLCMNIRPCLHGFCALLEIADDRITLPPRLLANLVSTGAVVTNETVGGQLLKARDLAARHGGRLSVESPLHGANVGTAIRLFLPLTSDAVQHDQASRFNSGALDSAI